MQDRRGKLILVQGQPFRSVAENMRQRLIDIGGECLVDSRPGNGTTVTMRIRLAKKALKK